MSCDSPLLLDDIRPTTEPLILLAFLTSGPKSGNWEVDGGGDCDTMLKYATATKKVYLRLTQTLSRQTSRMTVRESLVGTKAEESSCDVAD